MVVDAMKRLEANIPGQLWDEQDCADVKLLLSTLQAEFRFCGIIRRIAEHHQAHPDHGIDCACMDASIQELRKLTDVPWCQRRIDYVLRKVVDR